MLPLPPPFRQVVIPAERTVPLPARLDRQGNRSACRLSAVQNRVPCGAVSDTANALSPNADRSALRLVLSSNQVVVPDKLILQACPLVCDEFLHCVFLLEFILLLRLSARIAYDDNRQAVFVCG